MRYDKFCNRCGCYFITTSKNYKNIKLCPICRKEYKREYNTNYIREKRKLKKLCLIKK